VAQLGARLDGIEEVVGSNPIGSTNSKSQESIFKFRQRLLSEPERSLIYFAATFVSLFSLTLFR
jgi:hypothetical protein